MGRSGKTACCPSSQSSSLSFYVIAIYFLSHGCCIVQGCSQEMIYLDSGVPQTIIKSPYFPDPYPPNQECNFYITVPESRKVRIYFSAFTLEDENSYSRCRFDYVIVYDGDSEADPSFGTFCGDIVPPVMVSSGPHLYLHFKSDGSVEEEGFRAVVQSVEADYQEPLPTSSPDSCYSVLEEDSGSFYSPGYPGSYDHNQDCTFIIILPNQDDHIMLRFTSFDLEPSQACVYDYVEVRDGLSLATPLIGRYCSGFDNEPPSVIESSGSTMYVLFHTDISAAFEGFYAEYASSSVGFSPGIQNPDGESVTSVCDIRHAILTERGGFIVSHQNYPEGTYGYGSRCSAQIVGSRDYEKVFIDFLAVDLPASIDCGGTNSDYIEIVDGQLNSGYTTLGTLCENSVEHYTSSSPYATVKFHTDGAANDGYSGFKAVYAVYYEDAYGCENSDFHCDNNRCIDDSFKCDGYNHCGDDSDEDKGCGGESDLSWLAIIGIVLGSIILISLGVCTAYCFMNSQGRSRASRSRPTENGSAVTAISSQNNSMSQPYSHQNQVFNPSTRATAPTMAGNTAALPPKYSDIWKDPVDVPPTQGAADNNYRIPPTPASNTLYSQRELVYSSTSGASNNARVLPPAEFQSIPPVTQGASVESEGEDMSGALEQAQVIRPLRGGQLPPLKGVQGRPTGIP